MASTAFRRPGSARRALALALVWCVVFAQACEVPPAHLMRPGLLQARAETAHEVGPIRVHLESGHLSLDRIDLVLDTRLGRLEHGAVYNAATGRWLWRHEISYRDGVFVDASGAEHDVAALGDGRPIPGTIWVKLDATRVRTRGGRVHVFDAASGRLTATRWADGPYPELRYATESVAGTSRIVRIDQCTEAFVCSEQLRFVHDASGCLVEARDRAGRVSRALVDAECRTHRAWDALATERGSQGVRYEYGGAGRLRAVTNPEGERVEVQYHSGRVGLVRQVGGGDPVHRFTYAHDAASERVFTLMVTPAGATWLFVFDTQGRLLRRVTPEGDVLEQGWDGARVAWRRDAAGGTWTFSHTDDDLSRVEDPAGHVTLIMYKAGAVDRVHPFARPISRIQDSVGLREHRIYDPLGRVVEHIDAVGDVTRFGWDALGQLDFVTGPDGRTISFFDRGEHGHATRVERGAIVEHRLFDAVGNLEKGHEIDGEIASGRPGLIRRRFDAGRNVSEIWSAEEQPNWGGYVIEKTFVHARSDGRPARIERPHGGTIEFEYDALGRRTARREKVDGVWQSSSFDFDLEGRMIARSRSNGMTSEFEHDRDGRLVSLRRRFAGAADERVDFTWEDGRIVRVDDADHAQPDLIEYDAVGRVASVVHATGGASEFVWDGRGRALVRRLRAHAAGPVILEVTRSWSPADRLLRSELDGELLVERAYDAGRLVSELFGNGLARSYAYDAELGEVARTTTRRGTQLVEDTQIDRTACWSEKLCFDIRSRVDLGPVGGTPLWRAGEEHYRLHWPVQVLGETTLPGPRLRASSHAPMLQPGSGDLLRFDALGNLSGYTPQGGVERVFEFNAERNRLLSGGISGSHTFSHDAAGFVVERDGIAFEWTASGRVASIGADLQLEWDGLGRPVSRTLAGQQVRFGFGGSVVIDEQGWPVETEVDGVRVALGAAVRRYRHLDFRGNVQFVSDETGRILRCHVYDAFGTRHVHDGDGSTRAPRDGERGFASGTHLADLQLLGARIYDPDTARFLSPDPVEHFLNDFAYTAGDPVRFWDPGGTEAVGTPAPGGLDGLSPQGQAVVITGQAASGIGQVLTAAGAATGNAVLVGIGLGLAVVGRALQAIGAHMKSEITGTGGVPEAPGTEGLDSASDASSSACAPERLAPGRVAPGQIALLVAALGLALWLARRERHGA